jgi:hypothetical protein
MATVGLAAVGLAVAATPLLATYAGHLTGVEFENVRGTISTIPMLAVAIAAGLFAAAWGFLLSGAAQGPGLLWMFAGLQYLYGMITIGLAAGRSFLHVVPVLLLVVIGAVSPGGRPWAKVGLAVAIASTLLRLTPLPPVVRTTWYLYWLPVGAALAFAHLALQKRAPWRPSTRVAVASIVTFTYMAIVAGTVGVRPLTEWFHTTLDNLTSMLQVVWFLLGAAFVAGAIELGGFMRRIVDVATPAPVPTWGLLLAWIGAVLWSGIPAAPHQTRALTLAVVVGAVVILAARWRVRGMSREWLAGWFVGSLAALFGLKAYLSLDLADIITREAGALSIVAFTYAVVWEVTGRIPSVPIESRHLTRPSPLALYLGTIILIGAVALFGISANLKFFQQIVVLGQYVGALALWMPVGLLTLAGAWKRVPRPALARFAQAFLISMVVSVPVFLWRASGTSSGADVAAVIVAVILASGLVSVWPEASADRVVACGIGAAVGFGLAAHLETGIPSVFLHGPLVMVAALAGIPQLKSIGDWVLRVASTPPWGLRAEIAYYWVIPWFVAACSGATPLILRRRPLEGGSPS